MSESSSGGFFSTALQQIEHYIEARLHLVQLETTEKIAQIVGLASVLAIVGAVGALFLICISLMAGYYFAQVFDSYTIGFALVAGFYLLVLIIFFLTGKKLATFIANKFIELLFNKTEIKPENQSEDAS
jgi:hypothetical protein